MPLGSFSGIQTIASPLEDFWTTQASVPQFSMPGGGLFSGLHGPQLSGWGGGLGGAMQLAAIPGVLSDLTMYRDPYEGWLTAGLRGAAQGAGAGSMFGPPGAIIGSGLGYVGGKK